MSTDEIAIAVRGVHKTFKLPHEQHSGIKQLLVNFRKRKKGFENQHVLKGLSFEIKKGEFFGIVGRNGSGKSTLLKLLAGIYTPDKGHIQVNGSLTPFIELGVGFNPELTGRENVYMNGALLGFSNNQMDAMYDDIVNFAELERFMDQKLKNYSSGMQVRLAFSIAIRAKTDILVLDEVLAVGDAAFQKKCYDYFSKLKSEHRTVILVTHDMANIEKFCDRALLLEKGEIKYAGDKSEAAYLYEKLFLDEERENLRKQNKSDLKSLQKMVEDVVELDRFNVSQDGRATTVVDTNKNFSFEMDFIGHEDVSDVVLGCHAYNSQGVLVFAVNTNERNKELSIQKRKKTHVSINIPNIYTDDTYTVSVGLTKKGEEGYLFHGAKLSKFSIIGTPYLKNSVTHPNVEIVIN